MGLEQLLTEKKPAIVKGWFDLIVGTYPPETSRLLSKDKNQFSNPVGFSLIQGITGIVDEIVAGFDHEKILLSLDPIVRVRAIQDFNPAKAVGFIFFLKKVIRKVLEGDIRENRVSLAEVVAFESRVDELALIAFNVYVSCREKLYELRVNEVKNRSFRLLQRANLIAEIPEKETLFTNGEDPIT